MAGLGLVWVCARTRVPCLGRGTGRAAGGSCQEMEPAVDFAVRAAALPSAAPGPRKARRPTAPFPATRPRSVEIAMASSTHTWSTPHLMPATRAKQHSGIEVAEWRSQAEAQGAADRL